MDRYIIVSSYQPDLSKNGRYDITFSDIIPHHIEVLARYPDHKICVIDTLLNKSFYL